MKVYMLIFEIGLSSGHKELIGIYETAGKAEEILEKHMRKHGYGRHHYLIKGIELNKEVNIMFAEW